MGWSFTRTHVTLPSVGVEERTLVASAGPGTAVVHAIVPTVQPGLIEHRTTEAIALADPAGTIREVDGAALHWGPPNDVNLHWGTIFGAHVGMGRLDTTGTPLPSGGLYVGGMLSPTLGLVGTYALAAGTSDQGSAMGMAAGMAAQWWPVNRLWLRAGPALLLVFDPGFANPRLAPGATVGASYAVVKVGTLAIDARVDVAAGPSTSFGTVGVGVNLN